MVNAKRKCEALATDNTANSATAVGFTISRSLLINSRGLRVCVPGLVWLCTHTLLKWHTKLKHTHTHTTHHTPHTP